MINASREHGSYSASGAYPMWHHLCLSLHGQHTTCTSALVWEDFNMMSGCQTRIMLKSSRAIAEIGLEDHMCGWGQQIIHQRRLTSGKNKSVYFLLILKSYYSYEKNLKIIVVPDDYIRYTGKSFSNTIYECSASPYFQAPKANWNLYGFLKKEKKCWRVSSGKL